MSNTDKPATNMAFPVRLCDGIPVMSSAQSSNFHGETTIDLGRTMLQSPRCNSIVDLTDNEDCSVDLSTSFQYTAEDEAFLNSAILSPSREETTAHIQCHSSPKTTISQQSRSIAQKSLSSSVQRSPKSLTPLQLTVEPPLRHSKPELPPPKLPLQHSPFPCKKSATLCETNLNKPCIPVPNDICSTRGNGGHSHPGNKFFRNLIATNKSKYDKASSDGQMCLAREIVQLVCKNGGRYLKRKEGDSWYEMDHESSVKKTRAALRDCRIAKKSRQNKKRRINNAKILHDDKDQLTAVGQTSDELSLISKKKLTNDMDCVKITTSVSEHSEIVVLVKGILSYLSRETSPEIGHKKERERKGSSASDCPLLIDESNEKGEDAYFEEDKHKDHCPAEKNESFTPRSKSIAITGCATNATSPNKEMLLEYVDTFLEEHNVKSLISKYQHQKNLQDGGRSDSCRIDLIRCQLVQRYKAAAQMGISVDDFSERLKYLIPLNQ